MKTANELTPHIATHPGEFLLDELDAREISQAEFAKLIGINRSQLNEIIKGKRNINADFALLLESALGIDADFWMEAQKNFDLDTAKIKAKKDKRLMALEELHVAEEKTAYKFFKKEKVLEGDPVIDITTIKEIYEVQDLCQLQDINKHGAFARFRKSTKLKLNSVNIIGWVKLVQYKAKDIKAGSFNPDSKLKLMQDLKEIIYKNENTKEQVKELMAAYGIKLIYQAKGEKSPVDGVSFWSGSNPVIGMTLRYKRVDYFAFTLFHELGHVFEHLVNDKEGEFIDLDRKEETDQYKNSKVEMEANKFAESFLIPDNKWEEYIHKHASNPWVDEHIINFAEELKLHPSILRGRICHELNNYKKRTGIRNVLN